jgi:CRISPR-associated protein Csm1
MNPELERRSRLAVAFYNHAAATMAGRAGEGFAAAPDAPSELIAEAQHLALPGGRQADKGLPALTSLVGHLYEHSAQGYYRPRPLANDEATVMPAAERPGDLAADYRQLWNLFSSERNKLLAATSDAPAVLEVGYQALLQRYAWSMPAPGIGDGDVSLFDHARVSAAIAICLADLPQPSLGANDEVVALLIGGDVSGVQDWLYTIGSSGAAKSLRGRSVYLQLLSEIVALYVLDTLGLPSCNLLYVGGGNFYVLAPVAAAAQLGPLQRDISARLLAMHGGALYMALGHSAVTRAELVGHKISATWGRVNQVVSARKRQRFSELDEVQMAKAIGSALEGTGKLEDSCAICRRPIEEGEGAQPVDEDDDTKGARTCELCESFSVLGRRLPFVTFLAIAKLGTADYDGERINNWRAGFRAFGYDVQFVEHAQYSRHGWSIEPSRVPELVRIYYWGSENLSEFPGNPDLGATVWIYRPLAQAAPLHRSDTNETVATFDQLKAEGIQRWGVLRMDVDNLGKIFQQGLTDSSLSRVVSLSAQLRLLFEGYVPLLMVQYNVNHPLSTYLMYAGGDDLFVVGGWSHLPELASLVRNALVKFAVDNPRVTISGGISIALDGKYPVYQAARAAGRAEEMAKDAGKNRLAFLGQAVPWAIESGRKEIAYDVVRSRVSDLERWLGNEGKLNRSFLMRLQAIDVEWREWLNRERLSTENAPKHVPQYSHSDNRLYLGPWQWHLVYGLHRAVDRNHGEPIKNEIRQFINAIISGEIEVLGMEARWVELSTRVSKKDDLDPVSLERE